VLVVLVVLTVVGLAIGFAFDNDNAEQPQRSYNAGLAENYERADVSYLAAQHLFVTRLADGEFVVLYDISPKQQELGSGCRFNFQDNAQLGPLEQLPGFRGGFVEDCEGARTVWRADGQLAFGAGYGNLDRFEWEINEQGELIIDLQFRTCTRSRGVPGVPPFDERRCRHN
jgi:hypothetical protein